MQETEICLLVWLSSHAFRLRGLGSAMALIWRILLKATFLGHESLKQQNAMVIELAGRIALAITNPRRGNPKEER